ncbi:hypothetical protein I3843_09G130700 [Carya illinoinensis]|nr:hypothetical protein I3843_09G130700 [Carya illinoinensis]
MAEEAMERTPPLAAGHEHLIHKPTQSSNLYNTGSIPPDLCNLESLVKLNLASNELTGGIPECMGNLKFLRNLYLAFNQLTSMVPLSLWNLTYILEVNLSSNLLDCSLSIEMGNMKVLRILDLSRNKLSSDIPTTIGGLKDLVNLSLAYNRLEGSIPQACGELVSLEFLDLSNNKLSGEIPKSLEALLYLKYLNVSFNRLQGKIPTGGPFENFSIASFMSNKALCGASRLSSPINWVNNQLVQATQRFNLNNLLGKWSFGSVYKGTLSNGMNVAIKVLKLQVEGAFKIFDVECEVLRNTHNGNLIKIISICNNIEFKALVLEYMPNGNLEKWLYSHNHYLNILQRLNIMVDVPSALEYLHYGYSTTILHCDLKPSNILLDEDLVAQVADFGMAKLLGDGDSMMCGCVCVCVCVCYGSEGIISTRGNMYSHGILLMETFTRKRHADDIFSEEMNLKSWIEESLLVLSVTDIIDDNLLSNERDDASMEELISSIMRLALDCYAESPEQRINIKNVSDTLHKIKLKFLQHHTDHGN